MDGGYVCSLPSSAQLALILNQSYDGLLATIGETFSKKLKKNVPTKCPRRWSADSMNVIGSLVHPAGPLGHLGDPLGPSIVGFPRAPRAPLSPPRMAPTGIRTHRHLHYTHACMHPCTRARTHPHTHARALARTRAHIRRQACEHKRTRYDSTLKHLHLSIDGRNNREKSTCIMLRPLNQFTLDGSMRT